MCTRESGGNQDDYYEKVDISRYGQMLCRRRINGTIQTCAYILTVFFGYRNESQTLMD